MKKVLLLLLCVATLQVVNAAAKADFTAKEATQVYFSPVIDKTLSAWDKDTTNATTWRDYLGSTAKTTYQETVDAGSNDCLYIQGKGVQDETVTSEAVEILPDSKTSFYVFFNKEKINVYTFSLRVIDGETTTTIFDAATWSAANTTYDSNHWEKIVVDLDAYVGKTVKFAFNYTGNAGGTVQINGFQVYRAEAQGINANIAIGEAVNFINLSTGGEGLTYAWQFAGGVPETSTDENPVVTYNAPGTYAVTLTATDSEGSDVKSVDGFVTVGYKTPLAKARIVPIGYYTGSAGYTFVADGTEVQVEDLSTNYPQFWSWTFSDKAKNQVGTSTEQRPKITLYDTSAKKGGTYYGYTLIAGNEAGETSVSSNAQAIAVGGSQYIWNMEDEVRPTHPTMPYIAGNSSNGYYGANTKGITRWAERFDAPLDSIAISQVRLFFGKIAPQKAFSNVQIYIAAEDKDGKPGAMVGPINQPSKLTSITLTSTFSTTKATSFDFSSSPVLIDHPFFIIIDGLGEYVAGENELALCALERPEGNTNNSVWVYQNGEWKENEVPATLELFAHMSYTPTTVASAKPIPNAFHAIPGDVNGDGTIDVTDVTAAVNVILGIATPKTYLGRDDINKDGVTDVTDITALVNLILNNNEE